MLNETRFVKGMKYIKSAYPTFQFDFDNKDMVNVWYSLLSTFDDETFTSLVKTYCVNNLYPPLSVGALVTYFKDNVRQAIESSNPNPDEAWRIVIELLHKYGLTYGRKKMYRELERYPILLNVVKDYENDLSTLEAGNAYLPKQFKDSYQNALKREISTKETTLIGYTNKLCIEKKT